ncbi:MAG TPA: M48 family metalloprotease [Blastocatellia bacterium]|nr:M48 family metalloprotease [Blastocatellia bacterium]
MLMKFVIGLVLCSSAFCSFSNAQDCAPPTIVANAKSSNLFSVEQEMVFGELAIQNRAGEIRFVRVEKLLSYVKEIGERLTTHLPPTGLRFQFHIIDLSTANAFNLPGGHVLISRKLIAFCNNEDELAGVIAHELGHGVVRHGAVDASEALRKILNVTTLADAKDVADKYNLLIERARTKRFSRSPGHDNEKQLEADKIGLFAMIAAGYDPGAFASFFDRLAETQGKTGNWFSEVFGSTRPNEKRLREMIRATEQMPPACRERRVPKASDAFLRWQAEIVSYREIDRKEELPGLMWKKELAPKLRSDVSHLVFSQDGGFLLAQDDSVVTVIKREPLRVLFQIPIESAGQAGFTPDGKQIVFTTNGLRFERWSVDDKRPVEVRELLLTRNCWEQRLSPDGHFLACVDTSGSAIIVDTKTGKKVWEQKGFYRLSYYEYESWLEHRGGPGRGSFFRIEFSPDSSAVIFSRSNRFRFRIRVNALTAAGTEDTILAFDLSALKPISVGGDLKRLCSRSFIFLDPSSILGMPTQKIEDSGIFSFPNGKRLQKLTFGAQEIKRTANPDSVIIKPMADAKMGVFDLKKGIVTAGLNKEDATLWTNLIAFESANGKILIRELNYNEAEKRPDGKDVGAIEIPVSLIKRLEAAEVSDSFSWLLLSSKTRGGLWNLATGERKFYVRGFKGGIVGDDGGAVGDFPKLNEAPRSLVLLNPSRDAFEAIRELPEEGAQQYGRFVLQRRSLVDQQKKKTGPDPFAEEASEGLGLSEQVRFELKDFVQDKVIWSREFPKEAPQYSFDKFAGRLILYWSLGSDTGKAKLRDSPQLQAKAELLGNKEDDYLVEIVDAFAQKTSGMMLLETGNGSFDIGRGLSEGDWLVLRDSEGRVLVYSIKDGELRHRFFGDMAAINPTKNQIAVQNFPGEIVLYDLDTGNRKASFLINGSASFIRFNLEGTRLLVLSDAQSAYALDLKRIDAKTIGQ